MKKVKNQIATLLAGAGIIPVPERCLEELLGDEHFMFTEESEDGESEGEFMGRVFRKALWNKNIAQSTKQCMVINAPVGHGKMNLDEIEQLSIYIKRWSIKETPYSMNWGLYEIPDSTKMKITIVANSPVSHSPYKVEVEDQTVPSKYYKRRMMIMCAAVIVGIFFIALSLHYMELGLTPHPTGMGFVEYLKYMLQQPLNRYEVISILYWLVGGCAFVYAMLSIKAISKNEEKKSND